MDERSLMKRILDKIRRFFENRILPLGVIVAVLIYVLFINLHNLQILQSLEPAVLAAQRVENRVRTVYVDAPRGEIFDRYGRPLAQNVPVDVIRVNPAVLSRPSNELIASVVEFARLANLFGDEVISPQTIMITTEQPYEFTTRSVGVLRSWLLNMSVIYTDMPSAPSHPDARFFLSSNREEVTGRIMEICPEYVINRLETYFRLRRTEDGESVPKELPLGVCRRVVLEICAAIYMERYFFNQITVVRNAGQRLAVAIEERGDVMPNFYSDVEFLRIYPAGEYVAHLIGYIRRLDASEFDLAEFGGSERHELRPTDMFGARGAERAFQISGDLGGIRGIRQVEIDPLGRRVSNRITEPAVPGNDVFLTIDLELQQTAVRSMERVLTEILIAKILGSTANANAQEPPVHPAYVLAGIIRTNNVSIAEIMQAEQGFMRTVRSHVETAQAAGVALDTFTQIRAFLGEEVAERRLPASTMLGVLEQQGVVTMTPSEMNRLIAGTLSLPAFLAERVSAGEITPRMAMVRPYFASLVVKCVHTGALLAAANYPNFDNNAFVYPRDREYYARVNTDPAAPLLNRVFQTNRPPGSTFKMITAVAGLEEGVITPTANLHCRGAFTRVGFPHIHCWTWTMMGAGNAHGHLNVRRAISESCNYFFYEVAWMLGDTAAERIDVMNEWMRRFGLDAPSGVEIGNRPTHLSSPSFQAMQAARWGSAARWTNRDTVATAIGQAYNDYSTIVMAKYMATLVNGGYRFQSHMLHRTADSAGQTVRYFTPVLEEVVGISPQNHLAIMNGMYDVFYGGGTGRDVFHQFPIVVGGKTGTAETGPRTPSDETLAIFAPFHDPQIAIYIMIPFGDTPHVSHPTMRIAQDVLACFFRLEWPLSSGVANEYNTTPATWLTE